MFHPATRIRIRSRSPRLPISASFRSTKYETNFSSEWTEIENLVRRESTPTYSRSAAYQSEETS
jgi:hypothetical protein